MRCNLFLQLLLLRLSVPQAPEEPVVLHRPEDLKNVNPRHHVTIVIGDLTVVIANHERNPNCEGIHYLFAEARGSIWTATDA